LFADVSLNCFKVRQKYCKIKIIFQFYVTSEQIVDKRFKRRFKALFLCFKMRYRKPVWDFFSSKYLTFRKMRENRKWLILLHMAIYSFAVDNSCICTYITSWMWSSCCKCFEVFFDKKKIFLLIGQWSWMVFSALSGSHLLIVWNENVTKQDSFWSFFLNEIQFRYFIF